MDKNHALTVFEGDLPRREWYKDEWWFSVVDIVQILTESPNPRNYWNMMKIREKQDANVELYTLCVQLKLLSKDGKYYETDCVNMEGAFRIIQSIPSPKAEPFKLWLAKVGYERVKEIENPELAQERMKLLYEQKGYPKDWIDKRLRGIAIRQELTDEWKNREVTDEKDFAILTNEISKATFGKTVQEYKEFKGITKQNLRDSMTDWELILTMVGEKATTDITVSKDSKGLDKCKESAIEGGEIAGNTRKEIEQKTGKSIVSKDNFVDITKRKTIEHKKK